MKIKYTQYESVYLKKKEDYFRYLKDSFPLTKNSPTADTSKEWDLHNSPYKDPDCTYGYKNSLFYINLERFLNFQSKQVKFKFIPGKGIKFNKNVILRSDQLGFSAPKYNTTWNKTSGWSNKYLYARYLNLKQGKNPKDINYKHIVDIIWDSRTIGGSFLWPIVKGGSKYNTNRGVGDYIYDRPDITLLEIKKFFYLYKHIKDPKKIKNMMDNEKYILMNGKDYIEIYKWLSYFESFKEYVKFFCFIEKNGKENFVNSNYEVLSLVTNKPIKDGHSEKGIDEMDLKEIEAILKNTRNHIINRTEIIEGIIYGETDKK